MFVDADFAGNQNSIEGENPALVLSRTGSIVTYAKCPVIWSSKLQTEISLSTTEAEYIALSQALREVILLMNMIGELKKDFLVIQDTPALHRKVFEDNKSCLALAKVLQMNPRTKYIALKCHHIRGYVTNKLISIHSIRDAEQVADIFTKPLPEKKFHYLRMKMCGF